MTPKLIYAYLAGAIDSDGSIGIKKSTYHKRVRQDATNATFSERIMLKQVTPEIPHLLKEQFGGYLRLEKPSTTDGKPLWSWQVTDKQAAYAATALLPFLRVKRRQAELILELRESKNSKYWQPSYWFLQKHPQWEQMELITTAEAAQILGHKNRASISQAIANGMIVALPYDYSGVEKPRVPKALVEQILTSHSADGRCITRPPELIEWRERLTEEIRGLNKNGVTGTALYRREGVHAPLV